MPLDNDERRLLTHSSLDSLLCLLQADYHLVPSHRQTKTSISILQVPTFSRFSVETITKTIRVESTKHPPGVNLHPKPTEGITNTPPCPNYKGRTIPPSHSFDPDHDMASTTTGPSTRTTRSKTTEINENDPGNASKGNQIYQVPRKNDSKRTSKPQPLPTRQTAAKSPSGSVSAQGAAKEDNKEMENKYLLEMSETDKELNKSNKEMEKYLLEMSDADKQLNKSRLVKTIGELRKEVYIKTQNLKWTTGAKNSLAKMYRQVQDEYCVTKQELETIEAKHEQERAQLKEKLDATLKDLKAARKKNLGVVVKVNKALKKEVTSRSRRESSGACASSSKVRRRWRKLANCSSKWALLTKIFSTQRRNGPT